MEKIVYVDHSATTCVKKEVLDEMLPYFMENYGNPSSLYELGIKSKDKIEECRSKICKLIGAKEKEEIYFTSGGSEADNMIIKGISYANKDKGNHIITTKIEHKAVLNSCKQLEKDGFEVTYVDVDKNGIVNINDIKKAIKDSTILISIMYANNEVGTIQPIEEIAKFAKFKGIYFHTDAVQAIGNIKINVGDLGVDAMSISAHKFYGPKGIGAAYISKNVKFLPLIVGGGQENLKRAGTENVPAIVGMTKAIEIAYQNIENYNKKLLDLRNNFIEKIREKLPEIIINGDLTNRLSGNVNFYIPGVNGRNLLILLNMSKICASSGSACNLSEPSYVLKELGLGSKVSSNSIRITFGDENTKEDVDYIVDKIIYEVNKLKEPVKK